ncbi:MAG: hypothetical protein L0Y71_07745 [Gemmataceae bacterium]|nr:hypothetical protein [Gemmataceae bacterium]
MAKQLPCPNPTCTHEFAAEEVQAAEQLKCPRCGNAFRFRPSGVDPSPPAPPPAQPSVENQKPTPVGKPPVPVGKPAAPTGKPAIPVGKPAVPVAKPAAPVAKPAPPAVPVAAPVAMPQPAVPVAAPVAPVAQPIAQPVAPVESFDVNAPAPLPEPAPEPFADDGGFAPAEEYVPLVRKRSVVKNRWTAKHYVVLSFGLLILAALITGVIVFRGNIRDLFVQSGGESGGRGRLFKVRNLNSKDELAFKLTAPERWKPDGDLQRRLAALTAWVNEEGEGWLAVAVQDYGQQRPRQGELMKAAIERLEGHFGDALELAPRAFKSDLAGFECQCLRFKGTINAVTWFGECYLLPHHGFGYWFFVATATPWERGDDAGRVKRQLEDSKSFALVTERRGWTEQPPKMDTFHAERAPFSITVPSGAWEKSRARDVEETGELFLFGRFLRERDNRKNASILAFSSDKQSDLKESLRAARSYLEKRKQEENDKYRFLAAQEGASESGAQEAVGDRAGWVTELKLMSNEEPKRYSLLAVVHHGDRAYVFHCDCAWEHRQIWQQDFRNALSTVKFLKD